MASPDGLRQGRGNPECPKDGSNADRRAASAFCPRNLQVTSVAGLRRKSPQNGRSLVRQGNTLACPSHRRAHQQITSPIRRILQMLKRLEISAPRLKIRRQPLSKREAAHSSRADWAGRSLLCTRASADPVYLLQGASCAPVEFPPNAELVGAILTAGLPSAAPLPIR